MGALEFSKVVHSHQGRCLITCIWLHAGVFHLLANMLSLLVIGIRLEQEFGFEELDTFHILKAEKNLEGKKLSGDEIVHPRVPLEACLASFSSPEEVHDFFSTALKAKTTTFKTAGLTSFLDYLVLHMRKFVMEAGGVPKKLDIDFPISQEAQSAEILVSNVDQSKVVILISFDFQEEIGGKTLKAACGSRTCKN